MPAEPRIFRGPNGGLLSVDVTLLQLGLSGCRGVAERALNQIEAGILVDHEAAYEEIIQQARETLEGISEHEVLNEIEMELKHDSEKKQ